VLSTPAALPRRIREDAELITCISSDTRADWSAAFALVPGLQVAYVWHASVFTREVLDGLLRIGFVHHQQIIWNKGRAVLTRTPYWFAHEPCWFVRKKNAPWYGKPGENTTVWDSPSPKFIMGGADEEKYDHPTQKPVALMRKPILNHTQRGEVVYDPFLGSGTTLAAAHVTERVCYGMELDPKYVDVAVSRWEALSGETAHLEGDGRSFAEIAAERCKQSEEVPDSLPPDARHRSCGGSATLTSTRVPLPGRLSMDRVPPTSRARSRMAMMPNPGSTTPGSNPTPASHTAMRILP